MRMPIEEFEKSTEVEGYLDVVLALVVTGSFTEVDKAAVIEVAVLDREGARLDIPGWKTRSNRFGEYSYVTLGAEDRPAVKKIAVKLPRGAASVHFKGHAWDPSVQVYVLGDALAHRRGDPTPNFRTSNGTEVTWGADMISESRHVPDQVERLRLEFTTATGCGPQGKSPVSVLFSSSAGDLIMPPSDLPQNPNFGPYVYLDAQAEANVFEVAVPTGASRLDLRGVPWGERTAEIAKAPEVEFLSGQGVEPLATGIERVSEQLPVMIIDSTAPPLGDDTRRLRPNNLAYEFASLGYRVVFIPFGSLQGMHQKIGRNLTQVDRLSAPRLIEEIAGSTNGSSNYYICTSFPSLENVARGEYLRMLGWEVIYEVRDDMEEFNRVGYSKWYHPLMERKMLEVAHKVVTVSPALTAKMEIMGPPDLTVQTIPNGVAQNTLESSAHLRDVARLEARDASTTVGYVGHLTPSWFDWPAVVYAAESLPEVRFEIIGHGLPSGLNLPENIYFLGAMTHDEIVPIAANWKVGLIPFIATPLTRGVDPNKIYEYFAWGLRVVSARMGSVSAYPSTTVYRDSDEFTEQIRRAVQEPMGQEELNIIADFASASSWRSRAIEMIRVLEA